jgi:5'(3')-deoxyribonucleotidase
MNKNIIISCDLDNILNDLNPIWTQTLNRQYNLNVKLSDIKEWNMQKAFTTLTEQQIISPLLDESLWKSLKPLPNSQKYLEILNNKYKVKIVTASYYKTISIKMDWLFHYYPFLKWEQVTITEDKLSVKSDICIDDALHNLIGGNYYKILYSYPWNQNVDDIQNNLIRVNDWSEIYNEIEKIVQIKEIIEQNTIWRTK